LIGIFRQILTRMTPWEQNVVRLLALLALTLFLWVASVDRDWEVVEADLYWEDVQ